MSERKLRRMSRTELIDVIDTLRQEETPQETEALRRGDAERERLTERRRFWRVLRGTVSTLIVVAAIAVLLATLLLIHLQILRPLSLLSQALRTITAGSCTAPRSPPRWCRGGCRDGRRLQKRTRRGTGCPLPSGCRAGLRGCPHPHSAA